MCNKKETQADGVELIPLTYSSHSDKPESLNDSVPEDNLRGTLSRKGFHFFGRSFLGTLSISSLAEKITRD